MPSDRPAERLRDIVANCERIVRYTQGMTFDGYVADERTMDAVERCLQRISEACCKLGERAPGHSGVAGRGKAGTGALARAVVAAPPPADKAAPALYLGAQQGASPCCQPSF